MIHFKWVRIIESGLGEMLILDTAKPLAYYDHPSSAKISNITPQCFW